MSVNYTLVWNQTLANRTLACFTNSLAFTLLLLATAFKRTLGLFGFVPLSQRRIKAILSLQKRRLHIVKWESDIIRSPRRYEQCRGWTISDPLVYHFRFSWILSPFLVSTMLTNSTWDFTNFKWIQSFSISTYLNLLSLGFLIVSQGQHAAGSCWALRYLTLKSVRDLMFQRANFRLDRERGLLFPVSSRSTNLGCNLCNISESYAEKEKEWKGKKGKEKRKAKKRKGKQPMPWNQSHVTVANLMLPPYTSALSFPGWLPFSLIPAPWALISWYCMNFHLSSAFWETQMETLPDKISVKIKFRKITKLKGLCKHIRY